MAESNPFEIGAEGSTPSSDQDFRLAEIARYLRQTQPWVLLLAGLTLLGSLLSGGVGLVMFAVGGSMSQSTELGEFGGFGALFGVIYLVIAAVYLVPALLMGRFGFAISGAGTGNIEGIAAAVKAQRDLWIFFGGITLLFIVLYCGGFGLAMIIGMSAAGG